MVNAAFALFAAVAVNAVGGGLPGGREFPLSRHGEFNGCYVRTCDMLDRKRLCIVGSLAGSPDLQALKVLDCDPDSGETHVVQVINGVQGTTYCRFSADGRTLYSAISEKRGERRRGTLVAFGIENGRIGAMRRLAELPCEVPCHVELSSDGRFLAFAAYSSATCGTFDLRRGVLRSAVLPDVGMGPVADRQKKAYAHCAFFTPDQKRLGIVDLGCDRIHFFDPESMVEDESATIVFDPGDGPRHVVWSADMRFLYVVNELGNSVTMFAYGLGSFVRRGKWSTIPKGFRGFSKASAIKLTADGSRLLASNRGHDSIAVFAVDAESGLLSLLKIAPLAGKFPRDFEFVPGEKFVVVGHKMSDEIRVYAFDREKGALTPVGEGLSAFRPLFFKFMP